MMPHDPGSAELGNHEIIQGSIRTAYQHDVCRSQQDLLGRENYCGST